MSPTTYVQNCLVSVCMAPIEATPSNERLPGPVAELQRWLHGLPPAEKQSRAARLLASLCEARGQSLPWNHPDIGWALRGPIPTSSREIEQLHGECRHLLERHMTPGLWTVHPTAGDLPGIRLAPGGMMLDYIRELRQGPDGQRPG